MKYDTHARIKKFNKAWKRNRKCQWRYSVRYDGYEGTEEENNLDKGQTFLERKQYAQRNLGKDTSEFRGTKMRILWLE